MKVILFGATGMVGQGVLRECLLDNDVESVLSIVRRTTGKPHAKLRELLHQDFYNFSTIEADLAGYDVCFFCLGASSAGMSEAEYSRITYDITMTAAHLLDRVNPEMTFIYISGAGTDSSERGRMMWARVKGKVENELLGLFKDAYMFRPAFIQPLHGIVASSKWTRVMYAVVGPLFPVWKALFPKYVTTTEQVGRAMIQVAKHGAPKRVLENRDLTSLAQQK